jgi:AIPR protein
MADNDQIILDQVLEQQRSLRAPTLSESEFFEAFVAEQVLKDYDLSDEELESGLVGSGGDGGTDGVYIFANGDLVREDFDPTPLKKNVTLEVVIIQSKTSPGYDEDSMNRLVAVTRDLFNLGRPVDEFKAVYNDQLRGAVTIFRNVFQALASRFPTLRFKYFYATRGDTAEVHPNVSRKAKDIEAAVLGLFSSATFTFDYLGASELLAIARRQPATSFGLTVAESISAQGGYVALVPLTEFATFVRDEKGVLRKNLFEANVRDYQGSTAVNEEIQKTLTGKGAEDFWWLNNGVTVVATKAVQSGKTLTIEDPQIVNGLQTSTEIGAYFSTSKTEGEKRNVLVRVIEARNAESRDRIIKATNSQTAIPPASLRATDKVHRDIEEYLQPFGFYYDRRKNSHKNEGRPSEKIISIPLMAQCVMAMGLHRPDDARARPSSLLKRDEDYARIFNTSYPIELYFVSCKLIKTVQANLRTREGLLPRDRNNLLFYIAMHAGSCLSGKAEPSMVELGAIDSTAITDEVVNASFDAVTPLYQKLGASDQVAKGPSLLRAIKKELEERFAAAS